MDDLIAEVLTVLRAMWRRRWVGLAVAWAVGVLGGVVLWRTPDRFEATARVFVDTKSVLKPLMRDLAVEPDIDQTLAMLARTLLTRPNIELLIQKASLGSATPSPARDRMAETLMRDIKLTGGGRDNIFDFSYRDHDPQRAREVVHQLVELFVASDLGAKQRDTDSAREFIDNQVKAYEARLAEAESRLKEFKLRNLGMAEGAGKDFFARIAQLAEEEKKQSLELRATEQSRDALKRELEGETAVLVPEAPAPAAVFAASPELEARLDAQRRQLDDLLRRFTELHPDVVATKRLIARLEEQKQQEIEAARKRAEAQPKRTAAANPTNPVFQQVKLALAEAEASVASLRVRLADTQSRLAQMKASASRVPQVEAELAQLNRDYDVIRRNYEQLVTRREKASISEDVDATRMAQFRVIEPPRTADKPVFPNRLMLAPLVLLASLAAGLGASFLMTQLFPTFASARALRAALARPVLGSVSMLVTDGMQRAARLKSLVFGSGVAMLIAGYAAWMVWMQLRQRL